MGDAIGVSDAEASLIGVEMVLQEENPFEVVVNSVVEILHGGNVPDELVAQFRERVTQFEPTVLHVPEAAPAPATNASEAARKPETVDPPQLHRSISRHQEILAWLSEELAAAIGVSDAEALVIGVEMILQDQETAFEVIANSVA